MIPCRLSMNTSLKNIWWRGLRATLGLGWDLGSGSGSIQKHLAFLKQLKHWVTLNWILNCMLVKEKLSTYKASMVQQKHYRILFWQRKWVIWDFWAFREQPMISGNQHNILDFFAAVPLSFQYEVFNGNLLQSKWKWSNLNLFSLALQQTQRSEFSLQTLHFSD